MNGCTMRCPQTSALQASTPAATTRSTSSMPCSPRCYHRRKRLRSPISTPRGILVRVTKRDHLDHKKEHHHLGLGPRYQHSTNIVGKVDSPQTPIDQPDIHINPSHQTAGRTHQVIENGRKKQHGNNRNCSCCWWPYYCGARTSSKC